MDKSSKVTTNGKQGGNLVGKPHNDKSGKSVGGVKAVVTDAGGRPVELEGGEVIINKEASKKHWKELSRINQSAGNGVAIDKPIDPHDEDPDEFSKGGKIQFNPNKLPNKWILKYAQNIKKNYPDIWKKGGNIYGNQAFKNLERVSERGYWLDSEEWFYIKWQSFVARHKRDFRIAGVVAMLKWVDKVEKGWQYMKNLIEEEIKKIEAKKSKGGWTTSRKQRMSKGGDAAKIDNNELKMLKGGSISNEEAILGLTKGDVFFIFFDSSLKSKNKRQVEFTGKRRLKSGIVKYTFKHLSNPSGVKYYAYDRNGRISFAQGDMAISNVSFEEIKNSNEPEPIKKKSTKTKSISNEPFKVGDTGVYSGKQEKSVEITKITSKNVYFEDESGKEKRSEKHNFERLFTPVEFFAPPSSEKSEFVEKANEQIEKWEESGYKEESNEVDYYQILLESDMAKELNEEEPITPFLRTMIEFRNLADEEKLLSVEQLNNISTTITKYL